MTTCVGIYTNSTQACTYLQHKPRTFPDNRLKVCEKGRFSWPARLVLQQPSMRARHFSLQQALFVDFMT
jgi:hypothetical protein